MLDQDFTTKLAELQEANRLAGSRALEQDMLGFELKQAQLQKQADDEEGGTKEIPVKEVVQFFLSHPNPLDEAWHANAKSKGWNVPAAEAAAYRLATIAARFSGRGKANEKGFTVDMADPEELAMGVKVEMEHTDDPAIATRVSLDHLSELPDYYTRLAKMEEEGKKALGLGKEAASIPCFRPASSS